MNTLRMHGTNIGNFSEFDVTFPKVTLIAGENSTGKTTISKALYLLLKASQHFESEIKKSQHIASERIIQRYLSFLKDINKNDKVKSNKVLFKKIDNLNITENDFISNLNNLFREVENKTDPDDKLLEDYTLIKNITAPDDSEISRVIISRLIADEFNSQMTKAGKDKGVIHLESTNKDSFVIAAGSKALEYKIENYQFDQVLFFDNPTLLDSFDMNSNSHFSDLQKIIKLIKTGNTNLNYVFDEINRDKLKTQFSSMLHQIIGGQFIYDKEKGKLLFSQETDSHAYSLINTAAGIKAIATLDLFIQNGIITDNTFIILDEPESQLHPEWQVKFAQLLVLLSKNTNIQLLINSHSPFFVEALKVYCETEFENEDDYRFYFATRDAEGSVISDVTDNTNIIFSSLAAPYKALDEVWEKLR